MKTVRSVGITVIGVSRPVWPLEQPEPGVQRWRTPAGNVDERGFVTNEHRYLAIAQSARR